MTFLNKSKSLSVTLSNGDTLQGNFSAIRATIEFYRLILDVTKVTYRFDQVDCTNEYKYAVTNKIAHSW